MSGRGEWGSKGKLEGFIDTGAAPCRDLLAAETVVQNLRLNPRETHGLHVSCSMRGRQTETQIIAS